MLKALTLSADEYKELLKHCDHLNIDFLSTPFDLESLHFLCELGVKKIKIGSGDLNNAPLLLAVARTQLPVILSTGMSTLSDIEEAVSVLAFGYSRANEKPSKTGFFEAWQDEAARSQLRTQVTLLHCTSQYPAPFDEVNLKAMATLENAFGLEIGYSDHTNGIHTNRGCHAGCKRNRKAYYLDKASAGPIMPPRWSRQSLRIWWTESVKLVLRWDLQKPFRYLRYPQGKLQESSSISK